MIELSHVTCGYGGRTVVRVDDLRLGDGELTCVVGTNGSGKSTLLKAIAGMLPHEGSIRVDGLDVRGLSHRERAHHLGFLPQRLAVPAMSVRTLVGHGRFSRMGVSKVLGERDRAVVREALRLCELEGLEERQVESLSGGELQRAYLAMALAQEPRALLLDEPTASMDVRHRRWAAGMLSRLAHERGMAVVACTHDLVECFSVADAVVLVEGGRVRAAGTPAELAQRPQLLHEAFGVSVRKTTDRSAVFPYILVDGS